MWADQRHVPYHMISCSEIKAQGKEEEAGIFVVLVFVFSSNHYMCWGPAFWEVAKHLPVNGKQWINCSLLCLHAQVLLHLLKCLSLDPWVSCSWYSYSAHLSTRAWERSERAAVWVLGCWSESTSHSPHFDLTVSSNWLYPKSHYSIGYFHFP